MEEESKSVFNDTAQIEKIVSLVKLFQGMQNINTPEEKINTDENKVESEVNNLKLDVDNQAPALRVIKAAIPYLDYGYQKNLSIIVKLIEMDGLLKKYSDLVVQGQNINPENKKNMLKAIKPELELRHQQMLDMFLKIVEIKEIMEGLNSGGY